MKTHLLIIAALAFSVNAIAQSSTTLHHPYYSKAIALPADPELYTDGYEAPPVNPKDEFKMVDNHMRTVKGGVATFMTNFGYLQNGTVVLSDGKVLTSSGRKLYLQNGESIDGKGIITSPRCTKLAPASTNGGTCMVQ